MPAICAGLPADSVSATALPFAVAVTGGVASGKTAVTDRFAALGIAIVDADRVSRELVEPGMPALAEIADLLVTIEDKQQSPRQRLKVMDKLRDDYPEAFKDRTGLHAELIRLVTAQEAAEQRKEAAEKKKQGVSIGMSQEDVLASSWGKPRKINRSTYAWGTREQWVYDGGYLYFTNGVLDAIQH